MDDSIIAAVRAHAAREAPRECCGVVTVERGRRRYRPCRNIAGEDREFEIHAEDWAAAEDAGEIVAVCHSHPFLSPEPSDADRTMCETTGLPWLIVNHPLGHFVELQPSGWQAPLVGRPFHHGVLDCYTLVRDFYARELGIDLPDFRRPDRWWEQGGDLYRDNFVRAGFYPVEMSALARGDMIVMRVGSKVPNHAGVYLGDQVILHHVMDRLSSRDVYGGFWLLNTTHCMRHKGMPV